MDVSPEFSTFYQHAVAAAATMGKKIREEILLVLLSKTIIISKSQWLYIERTYKKTMP
jgi:hypothetical protein